MPLGVTENPLTRATVAKPREIMCRRRTTKRDFRQTLRENAATEAIRVLPEHDESIHCVMRGNFHGWDMVPAILKLSAPATISALHIATLGFNTKNAAALVQMLDEGRVKWCQMVCSVYFQKASAAEFQVLNAGLTERKMKVKAVRSHAKILAVELTDDRCFVVESSANLRSCNNIEQFTLTQSRELYEFHKGWIDEVVQAA